MRLLLGGSASLDDDTIRRFLLDDYARLVNAMSLIGRSFAAAEDAVQEATRPGWTRSSRGQSIDSLPNRVAAVALNLMRTSWRRRRAETRATQRLAPSLATT